jgi:hypothetical protein
MLGQFFTDCLLQLGSFRTPLTTANAWFAAVAHRAAALLD